MKPTKKRWLLLIPVLLLAAALAVFFLTNPARRLEPSLEAGQTDPALLGELRYWGQSYAYADSTADPARQAEVQTQGNNLGTLAADDPLSSAPVPMTEDARLIGCPVWQLDSSLWVAYGDKLLEYRLTNHRGDELAQAADYAQAKLRALTFTLPQGLRAGDFDLSLGQGGGFPLMNDTGETLGAIELLLGANPRWQDGELVWLSYRNHAAVTTDLTPLNLDAAEACWIAGWSVDVFDENGAYRGGEDWWCAFWFREGYTPGFCLRLRADAYSREDLETLAAAVQIGDGFFTEADFGERLDVYVGDTRVRELALRPGDAPLTLYAVSAPDGERVSAAWRCAEEGALYLYLTEDGGCQVSALDGAASMVQLYVTYGGRTTILPVTIEVEYVH